MEEDKTIAEPTLTTKTNTTLTQTTNDQLHNNIQFNNSNEHHLISQHQHAQDLLSALSALQTEDPSQFNLNSNSLTTQDLHHHHHHHHQQQQLEELDFDDPNLFSPFDPEQDQISNQPVSITDQIDLLFGSQPLTPQQAPPTRKVYSNSFSFQHQQNQQLQEQEQQEQQQQQQLIQNQQAHQDLLNHLDHELDLYNHLPLDDHHQFNFLFDPDCQPQDSRNNLEEYDPPYYHQENPHDPETDDLLARLDQGIRNTQEEIKLNKLDASIEDSLTLNQVYLDQIKKSLDHLNQLHQKAQQFLSISKHCVEKIQRRQQQESSPLASSSKLPSTTGHDPTAKNLTLVSDQISAISLPWFKHQFGVDLPSFEDAKKRDQYNSLLHQQPWQPPERRKLDEEVAKMLRLNNQNKNAIDWKQVAQNFSDRKPIECKIQWTQKQDPSLNKAKWTSTEIDRLFEIVKKFDHKRWDLISKELSTGRTPSECVKQFRIVTQEKREWTETDDLLLKEGVSTYGQNWQAVANHCGRSSNQCINRWSKTLRPDIKKGKWDPVEDEALKSAVAACGMVWKDVAPRVRGRTDAQCRERWCNILDPRIVVGNWSSEEDEKILRMRDVEGKTWSEISKSFNGRRTDNHCMRRHSELKRVKEPSTKRSVLATRVGSHPSAVRVLVKAVGCVEGSRPASSCSSSSCSTTAGSDQRVGRPTTRLGRVLIPSDSGFTRRHHHPCSSTTVVAGDVPCTDPSLSFDSPPGPSSPPPPPPLPPPHAPPACSVSTPASTNPVSFNSRLPNSRLRIVNKRIKYST